MSDYSHAGITTSVLGQLIKQQERLEEALNEAIAADEQIAVENIRWAMGRLAETIKTLQLIS